MAAAVGDGVGDGVGVSVGSGVTWKTVGRAFGLRLGAVANGIGLKSPIGAIDGIEIGFGVATATSPLASMLTVPSVRVRTIEPAGMVTLRPRRSAR